MNSYRNITGPKKEEILNRVCECYKIYESDGDRSFNSSNEKIIYGVSRNELTSQNANNEYINFWKGLKSAIDKEEKLQESLNNYNINLILENLQKINSKESESSNKKTEESSLKPCKDINNKDDNKTLSRKRERSDCKENSQDENKEQFIKKRRCNDNYNKIPSKNTKESTNVNEKLKFPLFNFNSKICKLCLDNTSYGIEKSIIINILKKIYKEGKELKKNSDGSNEEIIKVAPSKQHSYKDNEPPSKNTVVSSDYLINDIKKLNVLFCNKNYEKCKLYLDDISIEIPINVLLKKISEEEGELVEVKKNNSNESTSSKEEIVNFPLKRLPIRDNENLSKNAIVSTDNLEKDIVELVFSFHGYNFRKCKLYLVITSFGSKARVTVDMLKKRFSEEKNLVEVKMIGDLESTINIKLKKNPRGKIYFYQFCIIETIEVYKLPLILDVQDAQECILKHVCKDSYRQKLNNEEKKIMLFLLYENINKYNINFRKQLFSDLIKSSNHITKENQIHIEEPFSLISQKSFIREPEFIFKEIRQKLNKEKNNFLYYFNTLCNKDDNVFNSEFEFNIKTMNLLSYEEKQENIYFDFDKCPSE